MGTLDDLQMSKLYRQEGLYILGRDHSQELGVMGMQR